MDMASKLFTFTLPLTQTHEVPCFCVFVSPRPPFAQYPHIDVFDVPSPQHLINFINLRSAA